MNTKDKRLIGFILSHVGEGQDGDRWTNSSIRRGITEHKFIGNEVHDGSCESNDDDVVEHPTSWCARQFGTGVAFQSGWCQFEQPGENDDHRKANCQEYQYDSLNRLRDIKNWRDGRNNLQEEPGRSKVYDRDPKYLAPLKLSEY